MGFSLDGLIGKKIINASVVYHPHDNLRDTAGMHSKSHNLYPSILTWQDWVIIDIHAPLQLMAVRKLLAELMGVPQYHTAVPDEGTGASSAYQAQEYLSAAVLPDGRLAPGTYDEIEKSGSIYLICVPKVSRSPELRICCRECLYVRTIHVSKLQQH